VAFLVVARQRSAFGYITRVTWSTRNSLGRRTIRISPQNYRRRQGSKTPARRKNLAAPAGRGGDIVGNATGIVYASQVHVAAAQLISFHPSMLLHHQSARVPNKQALCPDLLTKKTITSGTTILQLFALPKVTLWLSTYNLKANRAKSKGANIAILLMKPDFACWKLRGSGKASRVGGACPYGPYVHEDSASFTATQAQVIPGGHDT
jgi:hypothetical protein